MKEQPNAKPSIENDIKPLADENATEISGGVGDAHAVDSLGDKNSKIGGFGVNSYGKPYKEPFR